MTTEELKNALLTSINEKKVENVEEIYVGDKTVISEYFLIVTVKNTLQVRMMKEYLEECAEKNDWTLFHKDGEHTSGWIVMDFAGVMVHIFTVDKKNVYSLDVLWTRSKN